MHLKTVTSAISRCFLSFVVCCFRPLWSAPSRTSRGGRTGKRSQPSGWWYLARCPREARDVEKARVAPHRTVDTDLPMGHVVKDNATLPDSRSCPLTKTQRMARIKKASTVCRHELRAPSASRARAPRHSEPTDPPTNKLISRERLRENQVGAGVCR